jgi:hypothetical protein
MGDVGNSPEEGRRSKNSHKGGVGTGDRNTSHSRSHSLGEKAAMHDGWPTLTHRGNPKDVTRKSHGVNESVYHPTSL